MDAHRPLRVGVVPAREAVACARLLGALERVLGVTFEGREPGDVGGLDVVVAWGAEQGVAAADVPCMAFSGAERRAERQAALTVAAGAPVDRVLRGARLSEEYGRPLSGAGQPGDAVLAELDGAPAWIRRGSLELVAVAPAELEEDEPLRERLRPGRCLALLALVDFLRRAAPGRAWERPPLQAAFVLDDPNLHWPSYGHVRYRELLAHAHEHGYHMAIAMVPLDAWLVHPGVARLFRDGADRLSVCVHGNDHTGPELGKLHSDRDAVALAAEALRRTSAFERRARVRVSRVMVPPHERLSEPAARALLRCGFEAVCVTRPYPWTRQGPETPWLTRPPGHGPEVACGAAELVAGGLPLMLRRPFDHSREDLVLRAFLGQALILYGHHDDLVGGLDGLAELAAFVNGLGAARWGSLEQLARGRAETRRSGSVLAVRPWARRVTVDVPDGVGELHVDTSVVGLPPRPPLSVAGPGPLELELAASPSPNGVPRPRRHPWPVARRLAGEGRDRMAAVLG